MILIIGVILGLTAGILRLLVKRRSLKIPELKHSELLLAAFLAQAFVISVPQTRVWFNDQVASGILIASMAVLVVFCWLNRSFYGVWALGIGLGLNLLVICLNGGWMPISPETIIRRSPDTPQSAWVIGERLGTGKDIVLEETDTRLPWLSDRFILPSYIPYRVAFSVGDVLIALGAFLVLWSIGDP